MSAGSRRWPEANILQKVTADIKAPILAINSKDDTPSPRNAEKIVKAAANRRQPVAAGG